jgi:hypothetical protein
MKKLALSLAGLGALVAFSVDAPASITVRSGEAGDGIELACKPRGTSCHTSFECCSQNCQTVNGKDACH